MANEIIHYDVARTALQQASTIDDAKSISDKVEALRLYARQQKDVEMESWLSEIKVRAMRRIGEISKDLETSQGERTDKHIPTDGKKSKKETLKSAGLSTSAANRCEQIADIDESEFEDYIKAKKEKKTPIKVTDVLTAVTKKNSRERKQKKSRESAELALAGTTINEIITGDFRKESSIIPDESVDLVFIDPPYDRESIPLYEASAEVASRILKPGGHCLAYCGTYAMPEILAGMGRHLRYFWMNACIHSGQLARMNMTGIVVGWKPIVWYVKDTRIDTDNFVNDFVSGGQEKDHHAWQQAESEAEYYIEKLCPDHGMVVDFFCGGGTTGAVAERLKRKWMMFEVDETTALQAMVRIKGVRDAIG